MWESIKIPIIIGIIGGIALVVVDSITKNKKSKCPICKRSILNNFAGPVVFNGIHTCKHCSEAIKWSGLKFGDDTNYDLNYLKNIVDDYYNNDDNSNDFYEEDNTSYLSINQMEKIDELDREYSAIIDNHFRYLEQARALYSTAINMTNIYNDATNKCIKVCNKDVAIAEEYKSYIEKRARLLGHPPELPHYTTFYFLAQLYTKLGEIDNAIYTCKHAINLGYLKDGSNGGMVARLVRLIKKSKRNWVYDYNQNILYDEETGEII